jgi:phasin family protein
MTKTPANPFLDMDFAKMMAEYRMPGLDLDGIMATQRRNIEALSAANQLAMEGMQAVMRRQTEILRQMMEESRQAMTELMAQGAPEEKVAKQADYVKAAFEKTLANMKELTEMLAKSNTEAADKLARRVSESLDELKQLTAAKKK